MSVSYAPILDVARGVAAGYQAEAQHADSRALDVHAASPFDLDTDGSLAATVIRFALAAGASLPRDAFLSVPLTASAAVSTAVRNALAGHDLSGVMLDLIGVPPRDAASALNEALADYRAAGALLAVGGRGAAQPELATVVGLRPSILRLGRDWVRDIDRSDAKHSAVEVIGRLAGNLDVQLLAEGVTSAAELQALAALGVPLAQGPFIGPARPVWPTIDLTARTSLRTVAGRSDGALRALVQPAHTATDPLAAAAIAPAAAVDVVVVLDDRRRPLSLLEQDASRHWVASEVLSVDVDTPLAEVAARAMVRPRSSRFAPLACTDAAGRFVGILRIERLVAYLAAGGTSALGATAAAG